MDIKTIIGFWRKAKQLTNAEIAKKMQMTESNLTHHIRNNSFTFKQMQQIAYIFNVDLITLISMGAKPAIQSPENMYAKDISVPYLATNNIVPKSDENIRLLLAERENEVLKERIKDLKEAIKFYRETLKTRLE